VVHADGVLAFKWSGEQFSAITLWLILQVSTLLNSISSLVGLQVRSVLHTLAVKAVQRQLVVREDTILISKSFSPKLLHYTIPQIENVLPTIGSCACVEDSARVRYEGRMKCML